MNKRAVILAGGKGTRLRPYTVVLPKPLMPIGEYPILEVVIRQLAANGFNHVTLAVNHQAGLIRAFFGDGSKWGIRIDYSEEDKSLGTIGPLRLIPDLPENFLIMNGDILTNLNFKSFYEKHVLNDQFFTVSSYRRIQKTDYGVLIADVSGKLCDFKEKPSTSYEVSMGIYMSSRKILDFIPNDTYGFDNLMLDLLSSKHNVKVERFGGYWLDIGRPDDYMQAIDEFDELRVTFLGDD